MAKEYIFMDMLKICVQVKLPVYALLYVREHVEQSEGAIQSHFSSIVLGWHKILAKLALIILTHTNMLPLMVIRLLSDS